MPTLFLALVVVASILLLPSSECYQNEIVTCIVCKGSKDGPSAMGKLQGKGPFKSWSDNGYLSRREYSTVTQMTTCDNYKMTDIVSSLEVECRGLSFFDEYKDVEDWMCVVHQTGDRYCEPKPLGHVHNCTPDDNGQGKCTCENWGYCNGVYFGPSTKKGIKCVVCDHGPPEKSSRSLTAANPMKTGDVTKKEFDAIEDPKPCKYYVKGDPKYEVYCNHLAALSPEYFNGYNIKAAVQGFKDATDWVCMVSQSLNTCSPKDKMHQMHYKLKSCATTPVWTQATEEACYCDTELCFDKYKRLPPPAPPSEVINNNTSGGGSKGSNTSRAPGPGGSPSGLLLSLGMTLLGLQRLLIPFDQNSGSVALRR